MGEAAEMTPRWVNNGKEDLHFVKCSPPEYSWMFLPVLKAGSTSGGRGTDQEAAYTVTWTYSPDPGINGSTSLNFEAIFDQSGGLAITSSKSGSKANEWKIEYTQTKDGTDYLVTFTYSAA